MHLVVQEPLKTAPVDRPSNTRRVITTLPFLLAYLLCLVLFLALIKTLSPPLVRDLAPTVALETLAPSLERVVSLLSFKALIANRAPFFPGGPIPVPREALCEA